MECQYISHTRQPAIRANCTQDSQGEETVKHISAVPTVAPTKTINRGALSESCQSSFRVSYEKKRHLALLIGKAIQNTIDNRVPDLPEILR